MVFYCFFDDFRKELITDLEKIKKYILFCQLVKISIYQYTLFSTKKFHQKRNSRVETAKFCYQVEKSFEDFMQKIYGFSSASDY